MLSLSHQKIVDLIKNDKCLPSLNHQKSVILTKYSKMLLSLNRQKVDIWKKNVFP